MKEASELIRTRFEYHRDPSGTARVIVCNIQSGDTGARGIALCSLLDQPNEKLGRRIALGRAQKALRRGTCLASIAKSEHARMILCLCGADERYFNLPKAIYVGQIESKSTAATA